MSATVITPRLAWRNVWRNRRRTILTLLTILVGSAMIIFFNAIAKGGHDQMIEDAVRLNTGHVQIHEAGFWENGTIDYAFEPDRTLNDFLGSDPRITVAAPRIMAGGLLSFKTTSNGVFIQGVDPDKERFMGGLSTKVLPGGRFLKSDDSTTAVIGSALAANIGAGIGDAIAIISQGFDGSIAAERLTVVGLFATGNPEYDRQLVLMPIAHAADMFAMGRFIHSLVIRLGDLEALSAIRTDLKHLVRERQAPLEVMGWDELMPELVQFIVMDDISAYIFNGLLFLVIAFGVLNTIQMAVFERTREFGVMLSIGTRPAQITRMVLIESALIAVIGIACGVLVGWLLGLYFAANPIDYSKYAEEIALWGISTTLYPAETTWRNITGTAALTFFLAVSFSYFPARRASRLNPIEAIRTL